MHVTDPKQVLDRTVVDRDGEKIGTVTELYLDEYAEREGWIAVRTGLFGQHVSPVPLAGAALSDDVIVVPFDKGLVKDAPHHDPEMALSREEEAALFDHYGIGYGERAGTAVTGAPGDEPSELDYTTEDAERPGSADTLHGEALHGGALHGGAGQASRTRLRRATGDAGTAVAGTGAAGGATALSAPPAGQEEGTGLDVTEPPIYPDDAAEAQLERERELREQAVRRRLAEGR